MIDDGQLSVVRYTGSYPGPEVGDGVRCSGYTVLIDVLTMYVEISPHRQKNQKK